MEREEKGAGIDREEKAAGIDKKEKATEIDWEEKTARIGREEKNIEKANFEDTGYYYTLSLIAGKYKPVILYCLMEYEPVRFNEMRRYLKTVSDKTLSQSLKELESDGLISRHVYPQIPPKVEYSLTEKGHSLVRVLDQLCEWGIQNRE